MDVKFRESVEKKINGVLGGKDHPIERLKINESGIQVDLGLLWNDSNRRAFQNMSTVGFQKTFNFTFMFNGTSDKKSFPIQRLVVAFFKRYRLF
jgi:hypothetical protein